MKLTFGLRYTLKLKQKYYKRSIPEIKFIDKIAFKDWKIFFLNNYN